MYLVNEILVFTPGRHKEAVARLEYIHGLMAPSAGFEEAIVAKDLGAATRHTVLRFWRDEQAYQDFRAGPNGNYGRNRPEGLYTNEPVIPAWNGILDVNGNAQGDFLVKIEREVPEGDWEAYTSWVSNVAGTLRNRPGHTGLRVFRAKDRSESLTVDRFNARSAFEDLLEDAAFLKVMAAVPPGTSNPKFGCFEVISRVGPTT